MHESQDCPTPTTQCLIVLDKNPVVMAAIILSPVRLTNRINSNNLPGMWACMHLIETELGLTVLQFFAITSSIKRMSWLCFFFFDAVLMTV